MEPVAPSTAPRRRAGRVPPARAVREAPPIPRPCAPPWSRRRARFFGADAAAARGLEDADRRVRPPRSARRAGDAHAVADAARAGGADRLRAARHAPPRDRRQLLDALRARAPSRGRPAGRRRRRGPGPDRRVAARARRPPLGELFATPPRRPCSRPPAPPTPTRRTWSARSRSRAPPRRSTSRWTWRPCSSRICEEAVELLGGDTAAVYHGSPGDRLRGRRRRRPAAGVRGLGRWSRASGWPARSSATAARCSPTPTRRSTELPPGSPLREGQAAVAGAVRLGRTSCAACSRVGWERPHKVGAGGARRCSRRSRSWPASRAATPARTPASRAPPRPTR